MALERQSTKEEWLQPPALATLPFSFDRLPDSAAGLRAGAESWTPLAVSPDRAGAPIFEGEGGAGVRAVASLEGVAPRFEVVDAEAAAIKALRDVAAPPLFAPLPGVVCTGLARGRESEELTDRYRHARTALAAVGC